MQQHVGNCIAAVRLVDGITHPARIFVANHFPAGYLLDMLRVGPRAVLTETRSSGRPAAEIHPNEGLPGRKIRRKQGAFGFVKGKLRPRWIRILRQ